MSEKESVEVESTVPPGMYRAPPFDVAAQDVKVREERDSLCPDERVAEIAPPFSDMQLVKDRFVRVTSVEDCTISRAAPLPLENVMEVKETAVRDKESVIESSE